MKPLKFLFGAVFALFLITVITFPHEVRSVESIASRNLEILTENESGESENLGLVLCICANIESPDGYYDFKYVKPHCHVKTGNGCKGAYFCDETKGFKWRKCGVYN